MPAGSFLNNKLGFVSDIQLFINICGHFEKAFTLIAFMMDLLNVERRVTRFGQNSVKNGLPTHENDFLKFQPLLNSRLTITCHVGDRWRASVKFQGNGLSFIFIVGRS